MKVVLLLPQVVEGEGGIPRHGRSLLGAVHRWAEAKGAAMSVLSLNDRDGEVPLEGGGRAVPVRGFGRDKGRFVVEAVKDLRVHGSGRGAVLIGLANFLPAAPVLRASGRGFGIGLIVHGIEAWEKLSAPRRFGLRFVDRVIAVSDFTRTRFCSLNGFPAERSEVVCNTLEPTWLQRAEAVCAERPEALRDRLVLLSVARLDASEGYKGVDRVLEALPALVERFPALLYCVVGDGDDRTRLEKMAERSGLRGHVQFLGRVPEDMLWSYYRWCDVFVLPSRGEGFGLAYLEAMAFGKPVVGGRHGGAPEVVEDGVTGSLVDHGDVPLLAEKISSLLVDRSLREEMGRQGKIRAQERFGFEVVAEKWGQVLNTLGAVTKGQ